jgi:uncharacterized GH25 family protein
MDKRAAVVTTLLLICAGSALAHETWLSPSAFRTKVGGEVRLDLTSGMEFPRLEGAIQPERVARAAVRLRGVESELSGLSAQKASLSMRQSFAKEGIATLWFDLKPKQIELTDDKVAEYLDEIDAAPDVRATWATQKGKVPWRETYTKHAKTFLAVGNTGDDRSFGDAVGSALELVPATSPLAARVGNDLTVRLLAGSKPLASVAVGLLTEGGARRVFKVTDADGAATFPLSRAGRAMLFAVRLARADDATSWSSHFCTLTLEVRE